MKSAVVFDFDGVITAGIPFHDLAYLRVLHGVGIDLDLDYLHSLIGLTPREVLRKIVKEYKLNLDYDDLYFNHKMFLLDLYQKDALPSPGLMEFLNKLKERSLKIGLASSTDSLILKTVLEKFGILNFFSAITGGEKIERGKPDPQMLEVTLNRLGMNPKEAVAIDDAKSGILAAKSLGMLTISYNHFTDKENEEADFNVDKFEQININW